jgi:hypothetical protein
MGGGYCKEVKDGSMQTSSFHTQRFIVTGKSSIAIHPPAYLRRYYKVQHYLSVCVDVKPDI